MSENTKVKVGDFVTDSNMPSKSYLLYVTWVDSVLVGGVVLVNRADRRLVGSQGSISQRDVEVVEMVDPHMALFIAGQLLELADKKEKAMIAMEVQYVN